MPRPRFWPLAVALFIVLLVPPRAWACGWSWETYAAEGKSLPCVYDAILGYFPKHTPEYHETVIRAVDQALAWAPGWTAGLDAKGLSLMHLGRLRQAETVMKRRHRIAPDAYASSANLGTLYTFTGDHEKALEHIDTAMRIEPRAHFGREKFHRRLVEFLKAVKSDPDVAKRRDFLDVKIDETRRLDGSVEAFEKAGFRNDAIDAVVSMITVYGADQMAGLYLTLGQLLALRGDSKLAYSAYLRALELEHVREHDLRKWSAAMKQKAMGSARPRVRQRVGGPFGGFVAEVGGHRGLPYAEKRVDAKRARAFYERWEKKQIAAGLPVWSRAGLRTLYEQMNRIRVRCRAPSAIEARPPLDPFSDLEIPKHETLPCPLCDWDARADMVFGTHEVRPPRERDEP